MQTMNRKTPEVSVIVPCRNEEDHIEACLGSILNQAPPPGDFEVIVADGMSDEGTRSLLASIQLSNPRLRIIDNPGRITSAGLNAALRAAAGRIIIRIDCHTSYAPDYLQQCVAVLSETGADNVGGPWVAKGKGLVGRAIAMAFQSRFVVGGARSRDESYEGRLDSVYLGCWPSHVFRRIGLFDEELVRSEDDEFNLRLTLAGGKIWQSPRIKSWYTPRNSVSALFRQCVHDGYWKVRVITKHKRPASVRHVIPGGFVLCLFVLSIAAVWLPGARWGLLGLSMSYLAYNLLASLLTTLQQDCWRSLPILPAVIGCYHFGYGYGFLRGVWDSLVMGHGSNVTFSRLTRRS